MFSPDLTAIRSIPIVAVALGDGGCAAGNYAGSRGVQSTLMRPPSRVERSLEETAAGLRFKSPKTRCGYRTISLPASAVELLEGHRHQQIEQRLMLGLGRLGPDDLVFALPGGSPYPPDKLSRDWGNAVRALRLPPQIMFHSLRHSHASALIAAGLDIVTVSRRLGHGSPAITLGVYAHAFANTDAVAAQAIERAIHRCLRPLGFQLGFQFLVVLLLFSSTPC